tara:strand:- start:7434 stop:7676 length:243 start_codon:yes stop_codon:yes gene_type:complete
VKKCTVQFSKWDYIYNVTTSCDKKMQRYQILQEELKRALSDLGSAFINGKEDKVSEISGLIRAIELQINILAEDLNLVKQ